MPLVIMNGTRTGFLQLDHVLEHLDALFVGRLGAGRGKRKAG